MKLLAILGFAFLVNPVFGLVVFAIISLSRTQTIMNLQQEYIALMSDNKSEDNDELWRNN